MFQRIPLSKRLHLSTKSIWTNANLSNINVGKNGVERVLPFEEIPGPRSYPIIGTLHTYLPYIGEYNAEALDKNAWLNYRRYGCLVREFPGIRLLNLFNPEHMKALFRQDDRYPERRSHLAMYHYRINKPDVYNTGGLLSTNGSEWWRLRSTFQKNFTSPQSVRGHIEITDVITQELVQWIKETRKSDQDDFLPFLSRLSLEVIGAVGFNERFNSFTPDEQHPDSRSSRLIASAFGSNSGVFKLDKGFLWKLFKTPLYKKLVHSQEYLEKVAAEILLKRVNFFEVKPDVSDSSLLGSFLDQPNLDLKDIMGMMVDLLMGAIDTTAYSTSFALYHIARNPQVQEKLFNEVVSVLPSKETPVSAEILAKSAYLRCCIKESLRLNPVAIGVGRVLQKDMVLGGFLIPKDTVVVTQNMVSSRLPQYVKDPLRFKPERWLRNSPEYELIHPFLSLPFGFGPRSCIARRLAEQNISITLLRLLREFKLEWKGDELGVQSHLINKPDKSITLSLVPRNV